MVHSIPVWTTNTDPASEQVASTDDYAKGWTLALPVGQTPASATVTIKDYIAGTDVSVAIKSGSTGISGISGVNCVVAQGLHGWVEGRLYVAFVVVTSTSGQKFTWTTWFDCVG